jgi:hypothetical protein
MEGAHLKETVESIGKTVFDTMEGLIRRFSGEKSDGSPRPEQKDDTKGPDGDGDKTQTV